MRIHGKTEKIRAKVKKYKTSDAASWADILGYKHYPDDVVRLFVKHSAQKWHVYFRIFDALNDFRNIEVAVDET